MRCWGWVLQFSAHFPRFSNGSVHVWDWKRCLLCGINIDHRGMMPAVCGCRCIKSQSMQCTWHIRSHCFHLFSSSIYAWVYARSHGIFPHSHGLHMDRSAVRDLRLSYHSEYHFSIRTCSLSRFSPWSEEGPKRLGHGPWHWWVTGEMTSVPAELGFMVIAK